MTDQTYASLPALKDWIGSYSVDVADPERDDYALSTALIAASRAIDNACNRRFWLDPEPVTFKVQNRAGQTVFIPDLSSDDFTVEIVRDGHRTAVDAGDIVWLRPAEAPYRQFTIDGVPLYLTDRVEVTGRFGWPEVPAPIEQACLILAARIFKRKLSPEGITGFAGGDLNPLRVTSRDFDVEALIAPYRLLGWA
jgi:hypothetical protein